MIDIHNHILWDVDDGPKTIENSIEMAKQAVELGISHIITTPHYYPGKYEISKNQIRSQARILNSKLVELNIPIKLKVGQEVYFNETLFEDLDFGHIAPIEGTRYILIEMSFIEIPLYAFEFLLKLVEQGYKPIIAHPERYNSIQQNLYILDRLVDIGCLLQMNAGSLLGIHGKPAKKAAKFMIKNYKLHIIGSDAHNTTNRPFLIEKVYKKIHSKEFKEYLIENTKCIWNDDKIDLFKYF
ncbi:tyrosine-protein phosphatase [Staphylococcus cohnii]|uniref:tyrosine-protein phosphatase n=1 Tax=Staphylococcus cohnii TaxID=29382 RepID=UPI003D7DFD7D